MKDRNTTRSHAGNIRDLMRMIRENENIGHELHNKARLVTEGFERCLEREKANSKKHKNEVKRLKGQLSGARGDVMTFDALWRQQQLWSEETFPNTQKNPVGALKHLAEEVQECLMDPSDLEEHADILILAMEAARKTGFTCRQVLDAVAVKQAKNRAREWPKSDGDGSEPINHDRSKDGERYVGNVVEERQWVSEDLPRMEPVRQGRMDFQIHTDDGSKKTIGDLLDEFDEFDELEEPNGERLREGY